MNNCGSISGCYCPSELQGPGEVVPVNVTLTALGLCGEMTRQSNLALGINKPAERWLALSCQLIDPIDIEGNQSSSEKRNCKYFRLIKLDVAVHT